MNAFVDADLTDLTHGPFGEKPTIYKKRSNQAKNNLLSMPIYRQLLKRYRGNFLKFAVEVQGWIPTYQQEVAMKEMDTPGFRISIVSGHGTGKTKIYASFIHYNLVCYPYSNLILTGNNMDQLKKVVWKELEDLVRNAKHNKSFSWLDSHFSLQAESFYYKGAKAGWFAAPKTAPDGKPTNIAGMHRKRLIWLVDEAAEISDAKFNVILGSLTEADNSIMLVSQGVKNTGFFYDTHHSLAKRKYVDNAVGAIKEVNSNGIYTCFSWDSEMSPLVTLSYIREHITQYGGILSAQYQIRVKGTFPDNMSGMLITRLLVDEAIGAVVEHDEAHGIVLLCDVAGGYGRDSSVITIAEVSGYRESRVVKILDITDYATLDTILFGDEILQKAALYPGASIVIDADGIGKGTFDYCAKRHPNVQEIRWGFNCHSTIDKDRFTNQKAFAFYWLRESMVKGNFSFPAKHRLEQKAIQQVTSLPYKLDGKGRYQLFSKDKMLEMGYKSPDIADTWAFAFLAYVNPISAHTVQDEAKKKDFEDWFNATKG